MSKDFDNTNRGVLFKNVEKEKDTHADYEGSINVDGRDYWLNAWIKKSKDGSKTFMSLGVKPKQARANGKPSKEAARDDYESDAPF